MRIDKNFVAVVTGGCSGLGLATVKLLLSLGAKVVIADINDKLGIQLAHQLKSVFFKTDVTNENNVQQLFKFSQATYGKVDAVIHCAGVTIIRNIIFSKGIASTTEMERVLKINVVGTFNVAKFGAKIMSQQLQVQGQRGVIIAVSSIHGEQGGKGHTIYAATKGAVDAMILPMARDLGKYKIRVMAIAPGLFVTPMVTNIIKKKEMDFAVVNAPLGKLGNADQFAKAAQSIIENTYASGSVWRLDGAMRVPYL